MKRVLCFVCLAASAWGQYKAPRSIDGHPDLQGFWANNNATPMERPKELANHPVLTNAEVAAMRAKAKEMFSSGKSDAAFGDNIFVSVWQNIHGLRSGFKSVDGETGDYSSVWNDEREWDNRTSLITDPPDGRIPPLTARAEALRTAAREATQRPARGPEDRSFSERCLSYGSPQLTEGYQSYYQIVQSPAAVMMMTEMVHDARSIPIDGPAHLQPSVGEWMGDSRGHWEGDTLVIDTTNYRPRAFMGVSSEKLHVTERLTRTDAETLQYAITINDPDAWTKPFSLMVPLKRSSKPVYEYACHEGNEGLKGILAGARADEAKLADKK